MNDVSTCLASAAATASAVMTLRGLPFLIAFSLAGASAMQKAAAQLLYLSVLLGGLIFARSESGEILLAYGYLCCASAALYALPARAPRWASAALALAVCLVLPGLWPHQHTILLLLGWEVALSSYSYCVDCPRQARSLPGYLFFVFVNPTVCYPRRGERVAMPGADARGLLRALQGAGTLAISGGLDALRATDDTAAAGPMRVAGEVALRIAALYAAHWGLASVQKGLFRQLGHEVPERYPRLLRAADPREFWARWNTYTGTWIRLYVFEPLVRVLHARMPGGLPEHRQAIHALVLAASFLTIGALHDLYSSLLTREARLGTTLWFGGNALALLLWDAARSRRARPRQRIPRLLGRAAMLGLVLAFAGAYPG